MKHLWSHWAFLLKFISLLEPKYYLLPILYGGICFFNRHVKSEIIHFFTNTVHKCFFLIDLVSALMWNCCLNDNHIIVNQHVLFLILFLWFLLAVMPIVRRWVKGPMWLHFLVGVSYSSFFLIIISLYCEIQRVYCTRRLRRSL